MKKIRIGIIGFGTMGSCLAGILALCGKYKLLVYDRDKSKTGKVLKNISVSEDARDVITNSEVIILAIKPQEMLKFLTGAKHLFRHKPLVISIAAGIPILFFEGRIKGLPVIRVMPNIAATVKESFSFIAKGIRASGEDAKIAGKIFSCFGKIMFVKEKDIDKATVICGSGPGYIFYFMNSLYRGALSLGFKKKSAREMALQTFLGAVRMAEVSKKDFRDLVKAVASQKGTTEAALKVFRSTGVERNILKGIKAAYKRAKEIAKNSF